MIFTYLLRTVVHIYGRAGVARRDRSLSGGAARPLSKEAVVLAGLERGTKAPY